MLLGSSNTNISIRGTMISKILVAIDHTESSQHALLQASSLARSEKSQVVLLSVVPSYDGDLRMMGKSRVLQQMRDPYREALQHAENTAREFGLPLQSFLDEGEPFSRILMLAEQEKVDLIVINRNEQFLVDRIPIGADTSKVISQSTSDILVVPEKASLRLDRILLAFDKSEASRKALHRAIDLSVAYGSELTIMTAFEVPLEGFAYSPEIWEKDAEKAKQLLQQAKDIAESNGVRHLNTVVRHGKASTEICELAKKIDAGLIVVGCKPINSMRKYLLGNVVEKVVRNKTNPVWISKS